MLVGQENSSDYAANQMNPWEIKCGNWGFRQIQVALLSWL